MGPLKKDRGVELKVMGYSVPAPRKCATLIRGLNLAETQVHLIASKLSVGATDLEEQMVDEYDSYVTTATNKTDRKGKEHGGQATHGNLWQAGMTKI